MRKLILETQMSIDGFVAGIDGNTDWMIWNWGPDWGWDKALQEYHTHLTKQVDCIFLSKQMADQGFKAHWQKAAENPNDARYEFARHICDTYKVVFSSTLKKTIPIPGGWENTDIAEGNFVDVIDKLKSQRGKDMLVYGGASFVSSLIQASLIDEFHLMINPTALGAGLPIFKGLAHRHDLKLIKSRSFECGVTVLHYRLK
jgi:dihydrofolate reductase